VVESFVDVTSNHTFQDKDRRRCDCCPFIGLFVVVVVVEQVFDGVG
jgi:hypothetical protein